MSGVQIENRPKVFKIFFKLTISHSVYTVGLAIVWLTTVCEFIITIPKAN